MRNGCASEMPVRGTASHGESQDLATALRTIGQELADLLPLILKIEVKQDLFIVTGKGLPEPTRAEGGARKILKIVWNSLVRHDAANDIVDWQLMSVPFARTYSQADLRRSDNHRLEGRLGTGGLPDIYSLGERLRIVGRIVQAKGGDLVQLTKTLNSVAFEYRQPDGAVHSEEYSGEELFRLQREYYADRESDRGFSTAS